MTSLLSFQNNMYYKCSSTFREKLTNMFRFLYSHQKWCWKIYFYSTTKRDHRCSDLLKLPKKLEICQNNIFFCVNKFIAVTKFGVQSLKKFPNLIKFYSWSVLPYLVLEKGGNTTNILVTWSKKLCKSLKSIHAGKAGKRSVSLFFIIC